MIRVTYKIEGETLTRDFATREEYWEWLDNYQLQDCMISVVADIPLSADLQRKARQDHRINPVILSMLLLLWR